MGVTSPLVPYVPFPDLLGAHDGNLYSMGGWILVGFFGFHFLALHVLPGVIRAGLKQECSDALVKDWAGRCVSALHGIVMSQACCRALLDPNLHSDFLYGYTPVMAPYFWGSLGYEVYDCLWMTHINRQYRDERSEKSTKCDTGGIGADKTHRANSDWLMYAHHAFVIGGIVLYRYFGIGLLALTVLSLMESISPFIHLRWMLMKTGRDNTWYFIINGLLLFATYFTCRILVFPYLFWAFARERGIEVWSVPAHIPYACSFGTAAITLANLHWFRLLIKAIVRKFSRIGKEKKKKKKEG